MVIVGLTGSIGMGKSTAAAMFRRLGVPVHDADSAVHRLTGTGGKAVKPIAAAFPGVVRRGKVDRAALGERVFNDPRALRRLEAILHPMVRRVQRDFLARAARRRTALVVLDVPLLFETGGDALCDAVVVVSAPPFIQAQRVLARPDMTPRKLEGALARQMSDAEKRRRADFVVPTGLGRNLTLRRIKEIIRLLGNQPGRHWPQPAQPPRGHARNRPRYRDHRARPRE